MLLQLIDNDRTRTPRPVYLTKPMAIDHLCARSVGPVLLNRLRPVFPLLLLLMQMANRA